MAIVKRDPIWINCEGSGVPGHGLQFVGTPDDGDAPASMCRMCGQWIYVEGNEQNVLTHRRQDILTMIDRGDFD